MLVGSRVLPVPFERIADAYRYILAAEWDPHAVPARWALIERRGDRDEVVLPAGKFLQEAERWRDQQQVR